MDCRTEQAALATQRREQEAVRFVQATAQARTTFQTARDQLDRMREVAVEERAKAVQVK